MIRANQQLLFQSTNQGLLQIRQSEVNYYQSLNVAFGTQAALIGGFTYGVFSLDLINYNNGYTYINELADMFWISSAITIAMSVHVILCTMLMQVLGPGLALNGPVGSMARAAEGMRIEQKQIIITFVLMMIMFAISTVLSCWVVMNFEAAIGCTIAFFFAAINWYKYCERIYLRFYWNREDAGWSSVNDAIEDAEDPADMGKNNPRRNHSTTVATTAHVKHTPRNLFDLLFHRSKSHDAHSAEHERSPHSQQNSNGPPIKRSTSLNSVQSVSLARLMGNATSTNTLNRSDSDHGSDAHSDGAPSRSGETTTWTPNYTGPHRGGVMLEGYMTKRGGSTQRYLDFRSEPWERRYFTLTNHCSLFIFKTRNDYRTNPKKPMFTRPLHLYEYYIEVYNMNTHSNDATVETASVIDDPANPYRFQMTLILRENMDNLNFSTPVTILTGETGNKTSNPLLTQLNTAYKQQIYRDHWVLQCDTEEELLQWVAAIRDLCPSCFRGLGV